MSRTVNTFPIVSAALNAVPFWQERAEFLDFQKMLKSCKKRFLYKTNDDKIAEKLNNSSFSDCVNLSKGQTLQLDFGKEVCFDTVSIWEKGDSCLSFEISALQDGKWKTVYRRNRILCCHTCFLGKITSQKLNIKIVDCKEAVTLRGLYVYESEKREKNFKVSQYLRLDQQDFNELIDDEGFSGYYDTVTDVILFEEAFIDENAEIAFNHSEELFARQLETLRKIIGEREVKIWCCLFFDRKDKNGLRNHNLTKDFVNTNIVKISYSIKNFTEKYGLYGIDYDWEFPKTLSQWKAYSLIVERTSKFTKVSVALPPWGIMFGSRAIKSIEHVNLMAYDLFDKEGDHSNSYICGYNAVRKVINAGFEKEQILLGVPTYGRTVDRSEYAWPTVRDDCKENGMWNNTIQFEYKDLATGESKTSKAYLNSYAEVRDKTALCFDFGIGGVMIFRAFCDAPYTHPYCLHKAVNEVILNNREKQ